MATTVVIMVGLQGSGKSTLAKTLGMPIISSDALRLQHPEIKPTSTKIFSMMQKHLRICIEKGQDVVIDAVNVSKNERDRWISIINKMKKQGYEVRTWGIVMSTPIEVCLERNANREAKVPPVAIHTTKKRFEKPTLEEGFDEIKMYP